LLKNKINIKQILFNFFKSRNLTIFVFVVLLFNIFSSKILPPELFKVYAADIDINELVNSANSERLARGIKPLTIDSRLVSAAKSKGEDMINKDYWSHYGPNNESPWDFILGAGYDYTYAGENLAKDFSSAAPIHSAWMASPSHRDNIINPSFENIGIAVVEGDFQGENTSIVVQMFGSTETGNIENINSEESSRLPVTGEDVDFKAPSIISPTDGDILNNGLFDIRGIASEGDKIEVFDKDNILGECKINSQEFTYSRGEAYLEGMHTFYAKAYKGEEKSGYSNIVNVTVDTIAPKIDRETAKFEFVEIGLDFKRYTFTLNILDNPITVKGYYKDQEITFYNSQKGWRGEIDEKNNDFESIKITALDQAGNSDEQLFIKEELMGFSLEVSSAKKYQYTLNKWIIEDVFSRVLTRSLRGQINFFIALIMIIFLTLEKYFLDRTGYTNEKSNPLLNISVFGIIILVALLGGGGEIL
jgi:hypothetical protein